MLFPTHLVVGALLGAESRLSTGWVVLGAALPDLVDKPLAMLGMVELYHTLGHSALLAVLLLPAAILDRTAASLAVGWGSHLLLDATHVIVNGRPLDALFLGWPLLVPPDPLALGPVPFVRQYIGTPSFWLEVGILAVVAAALIRRWRRGEGGSG